eukprot:6175017-Pleurochrysis_carterae.AAC.4
MSAVASCGSIQIQLSCMRCTCFACCIAMLYGQDKPESTGEPVLQLVAGAFAAVSVLHLHPTIVHRTT